MNARCCGLVGILFLGAAWPALAGERIPSAMPVGFEASIGGFLGASYAVELKDGVILYTSSDSGKDVSKKIKPSEKDWRDFRAALEVIGVWKWQPRYENREVSDGTQWSLTISYPDRKLKIDGDNAYPDRRGRKDPSPEYTKTFSAYLSAVQKLIGGRDFK